MRSPSRKRGQFPGKARDGHDSMVAGEVRFGHVPPMSTLTEIENALDRLPSRQKEERLAFPARPLGQTPARARTRRSLKAARCPALEGRTADLSIVTKERVRVLMIAKRHAAGR